MITEEVEGLSGIGDTMLRYEDRNYEGTTWKELTVDQKKSGTRAISGGRYLLRQMRTRASAMSA